MKKQPHKLIKWSGTCTALLLSITLVSGPASAQNLEIPNSFVAGTPALADEVNENFAATANAVNELGGTTTTSDVITFMLPDGTISTPEVVGSGELNRSAAGLTLSISTGSLDANTAYSIWWVIFNNPSACVDGCGEDDFAIAEAQASLMNASGRFVGDTNSSTFAAFLPVGFVHTNPSSGNGRQIVGTGLQNISGAEILVAIRNHGPSTGNIEQISTFNGDCMNTESPMGCFDQQLLIFPPLTSDES